MFSDPVVGENFFGRQEIIDLIVKRATALKAGYRQNIAIIGHQQLGKTSVLRQFLHVFRDPDVLCIYVEIKFQELDYFVDQFIRSLLFQYLSQKAQIDPIESLPELCRMASEFIPKTVSRIEEIANLLKQRHAADAYSKLFGLTSVVKQETGKSCIVILDEFHRLGEFGVRSAFLDFGKRIMVQKDTMYLLSSSSFSASKKILAEKLSLLFGNFERIYLEPFGFETSFHFIMQKLAPVLIEPEHADFLVGFTDGHPFFLETIVSRAREIAMTKNEAQISGDSIAEALQKLVYESQGVLNQYFLTLLSPWTHLHVRGSQVRILVEMAKGANKLKEICLAVNRNSREVSQQLKELMDHELILKTGVFYRFHNKIFKFWLREVYEKKELSLLASTAKSQSFTSQVKQLLADYAELVKMDVGARLVELLRLFRNEIVEFGEKKRQLPHFTEFLSLDTERIVDGPYRDIIASGNGRCWVCRIVKERASENDILQLLTQDAHGKSSPTRVLVALGGLDDNAKVLAKEKKIIALGLSRVNMLMDLYGKEPILSRRAETAE